MVRGGGGGGGGEEDGEAYLIPEVLSREETRWSVRLRGGDMGLKKQREDNET